MNTQVTGRRNTIDRLVCVQFAKTEVEVSAERLELTRQLLAELRRLYLELGEAGRAKVRVQLNQLRQQSLAGGA